MKINPIKPSISFKAHYTNVDIGASTINGSLKLCAIDENNNIIAKERLTIFEKNADRNEYLFERNLASKIAAFEYNHHDEIKHADPENQIMLTVCYPGAKISNSKNNGFMLSNFYYDDMRRKRFERPINPSNVDINLKNLGMKIKQTRHVNDMAGAGACLLLQLQQHHPDVLKEGEEIIYLYPGGGLGTGIIMVDNDNIKIKPTEIQHSIKNNTNKESLESDVRAFSLRKNYADALNLNEAERALIGENTMVVDNYEVTKSLLPYISEEEHNKASKFAIDKYMESFAQLIATRICESKVHTVLITGPIANSLKASVNKNPEFKHYPEYGDEDKFSARLRKKIQANLTPVGKTLMGDPKSLKIIFLNIKDNTEGAQLLQKGKEVGNPTAWYNIYN